MKVLVPLLEAYGLFIITPIIGWSWPALGPVLSAVAGLLGYQALTEKEGELIKSRLTRQLENLRLVEIPLSSYVKDLVADEVGRDELLTFRKGEIILMFEKDARGKFFVKVMGPKKIHLRQLLQSGEEFAREVIQRFVYHRVATEVERLGAQVVEEELTAEGDIKLKVRKWH